MTESETDTDLEPGTGSETGADTGWRVDELAQRAGVTVDTIRYYQREGLLLSGERAGRSRRYGPQHLERLERIRALQSRRFSLAAIATLLDRDVPGALESLLAGAEGTTYRLDELVAAAGIPETLARALADAGLLREPADYGHTDYDGDDLNVLRTFADLRDVGIPDAVLVELARLYADGVDHIQRQLAATLAGTTGPGWAPGDHERFQADAIARGTAARLMRDVRVIADYAEQRNLQRLVLHTLEVKAAARE